MTKAHEHKEEQEEGERVVKEKTNFETELQISFFNNFNM